MKTPPLAIYLFLILFLGTGCSTAEHQDHEEADSYILESKWPQLPDDLVLGNATGLGIDSENNILVFHRASRVWQEPMPEEKIQEHTILKLDKESGKLLDSWGSDAFIMPHGLEVDQEDNVWVTDVALHQVLKFNAQGELLMSLGEAKVAGNDASHFNLPTDIAVAADGSFYVSDGYGNSRVVKFSKEGEYLFEWGSFGSKEGEFNIPHGIDLDSMGNVYVADRENNRIQKFDSSGKFIALWQNEGTDQLYSVALDHKNGHLFGIDYLTAFFGAVPKGSDIFRFDLALKPQHQFGRTGMYEGPVSRYHDIVIDDEGSIYVGDILGNAVQKFSLKKPG